MSVWIHVLGMAAAVIEANEWGYLCKFPDGGYASLHYDDVELIH